MLYLILAITHLVGPRHEYWESAFYFFVAFIWALLYGRIFWPRKPNGETANFVNVTFDENGIRYAQNGRIKDPQWSAVRSVLDVGSAYIITYGIRSLIVPKRVYPDGGALLWKALEQQLIGQRGLVRRPESKVIINTTRFAGGRF